MQNRLKELQEEALQAIMSVKDELELNQLRVRFLGRKGELTQILRSMGKLPSELRPVVGKLANEVRSVLEQELQNKLNALREQAKRERLERETIDITLPGTPVKIGHQHPLMLIMDEMIDIFIGMGFEVKEGREIETDYYNFEALNIPKDHPARDMQDTFYISEEIVLRTHTSPMQIHTLEALEPNEPVRIICPGRVYRRDDDATHSPMFNQIECLVVDRGVTMGDLKGTLTAFFAEMFGADIKVRLRPSYFPFTEPSAEVDITCVFCRGKGCSLCKRTGWIELLGAGMVHPNVLKMVGYDPEVVSGFAFGMGVDRIAMLKLGISDIRHLYSNDIRVLQQF